MGFRLLRKLVILALVLLVTGTASLFAISPKRIYQQGEKAEASGDLDGAFAAYAAASRTQPNEIQYQQAMERLRFIAAEAHVHAGEHQLEIGNTTDALREFLHALDIDPGSAVARQDLQKAQDLVKDKDGEAKTSVTAAGGNERPAAPPHLELKPQELLTMQMVEQSTVLYQTLGRVAGINVLIDPDYHAVRVALDVKGVKRSTSLTSSPTASGSQSLEIRSLWLQTRLRNERACRWRRCKYSICQTLRSSRI